MRCKFCFLMERQVGIGSAAGAIEPYVRAAGHTWLDVTYSDPNGWIERLPLPGRGTGTLRGFVQVATALTHGPYDALFFLTHNPAVFHPWALARTPTVLWTDVTPALLDLQAEQYEHPVDRSVLVREFKRGAVRTTFRLAARCVGWSEWARRSFVDDYGVPRERTGVIAPGIDLSKWHTPARTVQPGLPRLLFVGGNFERKGGYLLLDVFREHYRGRCELDLVTRDPIGEEPGVRVHRGLSAGSEPLMALYRSASAFVLPTFGDCFSIASLEAMAMGLPVIVSAVGGIEDIVEPDGSGYLTKPRDGRSLAEAIESVLSDAGRRAALGARGRAIVESKFDAEKSANALMALLEETAEKADFRTHRSATPPTRGIHAAVPSGERRDNAVGDGQGGSQPR